MSIAAALQGAAFRRYLHWVHHSSRVRVEGQLKESAVVTLWHDRLFCALAGAISNPDVAVFLAEEPDDGPMARFLNRLGFQTILGRPDNAYGVRRIREWLSSERRIVAVTLDGPNGPRRLGKPGVVRLARLARAPLRPLGVTAPVAFELPRWDQCAVPAGRGQIHLRLFDAISPGTPPHLGAQHAARCLVETTGGPDGSRRRVSDLPFHLWARASTAPLTWGTLRVGSETQSRAPGPVW